MLVSFGFISDVIFARWGKVECPINILLNFCAWFHVHGVNIIRSKIPRVFWGECWNVFGSMASF